MVRNSTEFGEWQKEEREMCSFPFRRGITFDIMFHFEEEHVSVSSSFFIIIEICRFVKALESVCMKLMVNDVFSDGKFYFRFYFVM